MALRLLALIVALAAWTTPHSSAFAQAGGGTVFIPSTIEGRVVGPDGKAVEKALVRLMDENGIREAGRVYTDTSGRFKFTITAGNYIIEVQPLANPDFATQRQEVLINPGPNSRGGERTFANFFLKHAAGDRVVSRGPKFEQEVPPEAEREFARGVKALGTNKEEAYGALRAAVKAYPDYYAALEALGTALVKDGELAEAVPMLEHAVEVNPKGERSLYSLGVAYFRAGKYPEAVGFFERADAIVPEDPNTLLFLGLAQVRAGQNEAAVQSLTKAYDAGAKNVPEVHMGLAQAYINLKRYKEAAAQLRTLLKETPNLKDKDKIQGLIDKYEKM